MTGKQCFKIIFLVMVLLNLAYFYKVNSIDSNNYHSALLGRLLVLKDIIEKYDKENGELPKNLYCCLLDLKVTEREMYVFHLDNNEKLAFAYEYDYVLDSYTLIIGDRYPPNLIYIFKDNKFLFDSDIILQNGL